MMHYAQTTAGKIPRKAVTPCTCQGYPFPHRPGSGKCLDDGSGCFCGQCGQPAESSSIDFGYGATEFWGHVSTHRDVRVVSRCCEADLYADASLTIPYEQE